MEYYKSMSDSRFAYFILNLFDWLSVPENLSKVSPNITAEDVGNLKALCDSYQEAYEQAAAGNHSPHDIRLKNELRDKLNAWMDGKFMPFLYDNKKAILNVDLVEMGYHRRFNPPLYRSAKSLPPPILFATSVSEFAIRLTPYRSRGKCGKPPHASYAIIQQRIVYPYQSASPQLCTVNEKHAQDMRNAEELHQEFLQNKQQLNTNPNWTTIGTFTYVEEGILLHHSEKDHGLCVNFRLAWGNHHGYSEWSNYAEIILP
jgi:hypothetical protein